MTQTKEAPRYVMRHGRRIEIDTLTPTRPTPKPKPRRRTWAGWVKLPRHWISSLGQSRSANTYRLACLILLAAYEDKRRTGEVTLSAKLTGDMSRETRKRSARELEWLKLITLRGGGRQALKARIVKWE
jgi:hypothetical protein